MSKRVLFLIITIFIINGCTSLSPQKHESAFIVIKTPTMKYADMGFITNSDSKVKVEIYGAGQPVMDFEINGMNVCMSTFKCMNKKLFNEKFLSANYDDDLLENIFRAKPIFNKENLEQDKEGVFSQKLTKDGIYDISYNVNSKQRIFRDKLNKILIKVREQK